MVDRRGKKGTPCFHLVLFLMRHLEQVEMMEMVDRMMETMEMVEQLVPLEHKLHRYNRGSRLSIWESSPKTLHSSTGVPMRM